MTIVTVLSVHKMVASYTVSVCSLLCCVLCAVPSVLYAVCCVLCAVPSVLCAPSCAVLCALCSLRVARPMLQIEDVWPFTSYSLQNTFIHPQMWNATTALHALKNPLLHAFNAKSIDRKLSVNIIRWTFLPSSGYISRYQYAFRCWFSSYIPC